MSAEAEVLAANQSFYDAFARGDLPALEALWARRAPSACIHPGWDALMGRQDVMGSFRAILENRPPQVRCVRPVACVLGESAYVICYEDVGDTALVATNVFVREDGAWKIAHHQAGPVTGHFTPRPPPGMLN